MIHSFLLIGQSNAAGRGFLKEAGALNTCDGRIKILRNGRWQTIFRPVNPDRAGSGICFAESFAREYALAHPEVEVGIIPCADGGTAVSQWLPGELLFDNAVNCARLAMRNSNLVGILWHQGEGDSTPELSRLYYERLTKIIAALREELELPQLPFLMGGLGDYLADFDGSEWLKKYYTHINAQLERIAEECPNCKFVDAKGLGANPDNLHFSAQALEEFGVRYFNAYMEMDISDTLLSEETENADSVRSELEKL